MSAALRSVWRPLAAIAAGSALFWLALVALGRWYLDRALAGVHLPSAPGVSSVEPAAQVALAVFALSLGAILLVINVGAAVVLVRHRRDRAGPGARRPA